MILPTVAQPEQVLRTRRGLLDLLRIPVDLRQPERAFALTELCHAAGFAVSFNFTGVTCFERSRLTTVAAQTPAFATVIYLADSRGNLPLAEVGSVIQAIREVWQGVTSYHSHDCLGLAQANIACALEQGCTWIDASITGVDLGGATSA